MSSEAFLVRVCSCTITAGNLFISCIAMVSLVLEISFCMPLIACVYTAPLLLFDSAQYE